MSGTLVPTPVDLDSNLRPTIRDVKQVATSKMGDGKPTRGASRLRARPSFGLLVFFFLSTLTPALCHHVDNETAVGFYLGQSYG